MTYVRETVLKRIIANLEFQSGSVGKENILGLFDSNRTAQDFYCDFLKLLCNYEKLEDLDKLNDTTNYSAIDLGDSAERLAIQISSDNSSTKIKDTLAAFKKAELYNNYDRLIVLIIGKKQAYTTTFPTKCSLTFDPAKDIWDDDTLVRLINKINDEKLEQVDEFLERKLADYKNPDHLLYEDISICIDYIKQSVSAWLIASLNEARTLPPTRDKTYIPRKNSKNGISDDFFKENIRGHLRHNQLIEEFLRDPINKNNGKLNDYYLVTQSIQSFYLTNKQDFRSFEEVFILTFNQIRPSYNAKTSDHKAKILLHNMYFNCDIGEDPDD